MLSADDLSKGIRNRLRYSCRVELTPGTTSLINGFEGRVVVVVPSS